MLLSEKYDSILLVVDHWSKYVHCLLMQHPFYNRCIENHALNVPHFQEKALSARTACTLLPHTLFFA